MLKLISWYTGLLGKDDPATKPVFSGKFCYRGLIPMDEAVETLGDEVARNSQMFFGYHGHVLTFPIEKGKTMNGPSCISAHRFAPFSFTPLTSTTTQSSHSTRAKNGHPRNG